MYMLRRGMDRVVYDEAGVAVGVEAEGVTAKAKVVIGDPTYFPDLVRMYYAPRQNTNRTCALGCFELRARGRAKAHWKQ